MLFSITAKTDLSAYAATNPYSGDIAIVHGMHGREHMTN